ncbi:MAG: cell filamentation protein Fic [Fretibacterium sp.]|nr:cell filamentation protein Fic [Fretibacterium sp.]
MNCAHPFREGNARSACIWLDLILKESLRMIVDWSRGDKEDDLLAMEHSPVLDDKIKKLLQCVLTDHVDDREIFIKGINSS